MEDLEEEGSWAHESCETQYLLKHQAEGCRMQYFQGNLWEAGWAKGHLFFKGLLPAYDSLKANWKSPQRIKEIARLPASTFEKLRVIFNMFIANLVRQDNMKWQTAKVFVGIHTAIMATSLNTTKTRSRTKLFWLAGAVTNKGILSKYAEVQELATIELTNSSMYFWQWRYSASPSVAWISAVSSKKSVQFSLSQVAWILHGSLQLLHSVVGLLSVYGF